MYSFVIAKKTKGKVMDMNQKKDIILKYKQT